MLSQIRNKGTFSKTKIYKFRRKKTTVLEVNFITPLKQKESSLKLEDNGNKIEDELIIGETFNKYFVDNFVRLLDSSYHQVF